METTRVQAKLLTGRPPTKKWRLTYVFRRGPKHCRSVDYNTILSFSKDLGQYSFRACLVQKARAFTWMGKAAPVSMFSVGLGVSNLFFPLGLRSVLVASGQGLAFGRLPG